MPLYFLEAYRSDFMQKQTTSVWFKINADDRADVQQVSDQSGLKITAVYREALKVGLRELVKIYQMSKQ